MKIKQLIYLTFLFALFVNQGHCQTKAKNSDEIYSAVQQQAVFPGGITAFMQYVASSVRYPAKDKEMNVQGRVVLTFVIEKDGSLSDVKVVRSVSPAIDAEALRVVQASPKWEPGKQDHVPVRSQFTLPISFSLPKK